MGLLTPRDQIVIDIDNMQTPPRVNVNLTPGVNPLVAISYLAKIIEQLSVGLYAQSLRPMTPLTEEGKTKNGPSS